MDGLGLITVATSNVTSCCCRSGSLTTTSNRFLLFPSLNTSAVSRLRLRRSVSFARRRKFTVFATSDDSQFDEWELMELKFGRLLGEDPKLTLAKIITRRTNPDASFVEIEKEFYKNKGKMPERKEVPFNVDKRSSSSSSVDGLNLVRPVPKKGVKFQTDDKPILPQVRKPSGQNAKAVVGRSSVPNVILRKPTVFKEDDIEDERSKLKMKPNLTIKMRDEQVNDKFSDMTLLRKPELKMEDIDEKDGAIKDVDAKSVSESYRLNVKMSEEKEKYSGFPILNKPEVMNVEQISESSRSENKTNSGQEEDSVIGLQPPVPRNMKSFEEETSMNKPNYSSLVDSTPKFEASLIGKPKRLDQSMNVSSSSSVAEKFPIRTTSLEINESSEVKNIVATSPSEDFDWDKAQELANKEERGEVELISSNTKGFMVSFGSLVGFLPYRNLASKWKFLAFETWLRRKGLDPSMYRQNLGIIGNNDLGNKNSLHDSSLDPVIEQKLDGQISPDLKLEDLLRIYDQEKLKFLQSFVGQKLNVIVITADKNSKKLIVSMRPKEKDELVEKKKSLMTKLRVGDVIKCCIQKITYFGIFVEIEGVPALIHQTEVSWDATLDPSSYFKVGQTVEAKVHQLDFSLGRIFLSMKEITPDPLIESLESVVGGRDPLDGKLQLAEPDTEWPDVESLIKELEKIEGIQSVSKGSFFLSPSLAPTFQVYMTSIFENQYKLLARSGNKVQEVIVESSLSKEEMKSTILSCASRVE